MSGLLQSCSRQYGMFLTANARTISSYLLKTSGKQSLLLRPLQFNLFKNQSPRLCATIASSHSDHNHSRIWNAERLLSGGLIAVMPLSFMIQSPIMDYLLALSMVLHIHWGMEAVVVDYIRPMLFGPMIPKLSLYALYAISIASLAGLFYFNYTDVGLVQGLRMIMKL